VGSPKNGSFDFAEGLACRAGAKANVPLCVGCRSNFHLNLFNFFFYYKIFCGSARKKIKHIGLAMCVGIEFFCLVCQVLFNWLLFVRRVVSLFR